MSLSLVSIIIPCFNDAQYIEQAIDSALNQTYTNKEVIVVDDGSNVETKAVLKKLEPKITKLITQENKGQSTARNVGINAANGNYILVLDSDDFFEPTFCEKAIEVFLEKRSVKLVTCEANLIYTDASIEIYKPNGGTISNFMYTNDALGTSLFLKEDWKSIGGYDETMRKGFEDWEFFIRLLKNGGTCFVIPEVLYNYRKRNDSTTNKANRIKYDLLNYIYTKHKEIYIADFDKFVSKLLELSNLQEKNKFKILKTIDYQLGQTILKPIRFIKSLFK
jgi:glycosyltransferase involved in cell wall biosynthesis